MIKITEPKQKIKTIKMGDPGWYIKNGITITPRAGFEVSKSCPREYGLILSECIDRGWIKPIAYVKESEYVWDKLGE
jgi:hypothetical protein